MGLEHRDDLGQFLVSQVLQACQHSSLEEDFGDATAILRRVQLDCLENVRSHLLAVNEAVWDRVRSQDGVAEGAGRSASDQSGNWKKQHA